MGTPLLRLGDRLYHHGTLATGPSAGTRAFYAVPDNVGCAYEGWLSSLYGPGGSASKGRPPEGGWGGGGCARRR